MKKLIILMLVLLTITACRSRRKNLNITEFKTAEIQRIDTVKMDSIVKFDKKKVVDKIKVQKNEKIFETEINIKGKTDSVKDFDFHNVVEGDTLQTIHISGNADFTIKTKQSKKSEKTETKKEEHYDNIIQEVARKAVSQETIKETAGKIKQEAKNINEKGFTAGAWLTWLAMFVFVGSAIWLFYYLSGSWRQIFERLNKMR